MRVKIDTFFFLYLAVLRASQLFSFFKRQFYHLNI